MTEEFGKLMRDIQKQDMKNRKFKKLMLKKSREPSKTPKPQLAHGKFSLQSKSQLYSGARRQTKETWDKRIHKLVGK